MVEHIYNYENLNC